jgi:hypothetical protein
MLGTTIREKFEPMISDSPHYNPFRQKTEDVLLDRKLDLEPGKLGCNLNSTINKLCDIWQIVVGFASVFFACNMKWLD